MKCIKKIIAIVFVMTMLLITSVNVYAATPRWSYLTTIAVDMDFDNYNGVDIEVMCDADVTETDKIKVVCELQQYDGSWKTIKSWTETRNNTCIMFSKSYAVYKNYSYRVKITASTYKNSVLLETVTGYYEETFYN